MKLSSLKKSTFFLNHPFKECVRCLTTCISLCEYYATTQYCYDSLDETSKNSNVSGASHFFPYLDSQAPTAVVIARTVRTAGQMSVSWKEFGAVHK